MNSQTEATDMIWWILK